MISQSQLQPRPQRRVPGVAAAGVLLAIAVVACWAGASRIANGGWPDFFIATMSALSSTPWASVAGWLLGIGLILVGIVLLAAAIKRGTPRNLPLAMPETDHAAQRMGYLSAAGLARLTTGHLRLIDGVESARATVSGQRLRVRVWTTLEDTTALTGRLRSSIEERLKSTGLDPLPSVSVSVRWRES